MLEIGEGQNGSQIEVRLGDLFGLRLFENPTSGYRWQVISNGGPTLVNEEDGFEGAPGTCGTGGIRHWRFRAVQPGTANLEMEYRRSWERQATRTFRVTIQVQSG